VGLTVWIVIARVRVKSVMMEEIERDARFNMRNALGHVFPKFGAVIQQISPQFSVVYRQASDAESYGLDQVAGVGFGKALEFLIKDYAKRENPAKGDAIEKTPLATVIRDNISDSAIRDSSDLARWLRNDETHYVRKYAGKDIQDLKRLIAIAVALIQNSEQRRALERTTATEKAEFPSDS
jgi:hypothetical protein